MILEVEEPSLVLTLSLCFDWLLLLLLGALWRPFDSVHKSHGNVVANRKSWTMDVITSTSAPHSWLNFFIHIYIGYVHTYIDILLLEIDRTKTDPSVTHTHTHHRLPQNSILFLYHYYLGFIHPAVASSSVFQKVLVSRSRTQ
jgi:hypothetical protein